MSRKHWTEAQIWINTQGERLTAGELLTRYRVELRGVSLCWATFSVHAGGTVWSRLPEAIAETAHIRAELG
jgi:hypothetical protein